MAGTAFGGPGPIDSSSVEGASNLPYAIPNLSVELHTTTSAGAGAVVAFGGFDAHSVFD